MTFRQFLAALGVLDVLTPAQVVLVCVGFDGIDPARLRTREQRRLARELFGEVTEVPPSARDVFALVAGARGGKTWLGALRLAHLALTVPLRLAPGEHASAPLVAPDLRLARQAMRYIVGALRASAQLAPCIVNETADSLTLRRPDGLTVVVECLPASRGGSAVRGRTLVGALLDEASFFRDSDSVVNDDELFRAVAPRIVKGGQLLIQSTPWSTSGLLYELHQENFGKPTTCLAAWAPTLTLRPDLAALVERESLRDPRNAAREFGAEFLSGESNLLDAADVDAAVDDVARREPRDACVYGMTIDLGLRNDASALLVFHVETVRRPSAPPVNLLVVDAVAHLQPTPTKRVSLELVEEVVGTLAARYGVSRVHGDLHLADAIAPRLQARGIKFLEVQMSSTAQEHRAVSLAHRFEGRSVRLVRHAELIKELKQLRLTRHAGGRVSVGAPEGRRRHDDLADTLLLASEVAASLPALAGNIENEVRVWHGEGGITVTSKWFEKVTNPVTGLVTRVPAAPPRGSPEWLQLRREQLAQGIVVVDDPLDEGPSGLNRSVLQF